REAAKLRDMAETSKRLAKIASQAAHIGALATGDLEDAVIAIRHFDQLEVDDVDLARLERDLLPITGKIVGALAVHLDSGVNRGRLVDQADEAGQDRLDLLAAGPPITAGDDFALGIVTIGRFPPTNGEAIGFLAFHYPCDSLGRLAKGQREKPGRQRVQRPPVAYFARIEQAAHAIDHVGRRYARGFVDDQPAVDVAAFTTTGHRPPPASLCLFRLDPDRCRYRWRPFHPDPAGPARYPADVLFALLHQRRGPAESRVAAYTAARRFLPGADESRELRGAGLREWPRDPARRGAAQTPSRS